MSKVPYVKTVQVNLRLPIGLYDEVIKIMETEKNGTPPQQFI